MVQLVFPEHANPYGTLYGGRMMSWIATAGTLAASRFAHGLVVLGAMDDLDFLTPVHAGEIVTIDAQVEYVGRSSMEVGVAVKSEAPGRSAPRRTTSSHLAFIALDDRERPRPVGGTIAPASRAEAAVHEAAAARKAARLARVEAHVAESPFVGLTPRMMPPAAAIPPGVPPAHLAHLVTPEDAFSGTLMFAGKLLALLDEGAAITATRYARGPVVTASLDTVYFYTPLRVGEIADIAAAVTFVSRTSAEVGVRVDGERVGGDRHHTCTAYLTMVHLDDAGRPTPMPPPPGEGRPEGDARRYWLAGAMRTRARKERVAALRAGHDAH
ncbi:MAG TPA: acyl-CoA thioesterase [bacterium]|nr:acyl-CoA thioesterase [bacterium]